MNIYMVVDMEGISCVSYATQVRPGTADYEQGKKYLESDLLAACNGAIAGGADKIVIYDMHVFGKNVFLEKLPPIVTVVAGKPPSLLGTQFAMSNTFDGLFLIGTHAKTYTPNAVFPHAYSFQNATIKVNGIEVGEIGVESMIAGHYGVPLALVTGDLAASEEAIALAPNVETAIVKYCSGYQTAACMPPAYTSQLIFDKAKKAVMEIANKKPLALDKHKKIEIHYNGEVYQKIMSVNNMRQVGEKDFVLEGENFHEIWDGINIAYCDWLDWKGE